MIGLDAEIQDGSLAGAARAVGELDSVYDPLGPLQRIRFDRGLRRATGWDLKRWRYARKTGRWDAAKLEALAIDLGRLAAEALAAGAEEPARRLASGQVLAARAASILRELTAASNTTVWGSGRKW